MKYKLINSDVYAGLLHLPNNSIDFVVTSPPYWGQRDYGFKLQIGNENTYEEYINKLVKIFSLLREKLSPSGVFFLNIGDKYLSKYGKSPLGFIPYKLAYFMVDDGWILNETLIWYKPNHMPSSVVNRFTNSYEPIFVFSKHNNNIYTSKNNKDGNSNVLKINLQPTPYKHVAVYPEKLVKSLLNKVLLKNHFTILDPFAGSGTILKATIDYNETLNAIMIEHHPDYIEMIKRRCKLTNNYDVLKYDYIPYTYRTNTQDEQLSLFENNKKFLPKVDIPKTGFTKICNCKEDYYLLLKKFSLKEIKNKINPNSTCFIGCKEHDIELIYSTSLLNNKGWVIRNMVIIKDNNRWFPVFMIVDDNKKTNYIFNYKNLKLKSKTDYKKNWNSINFLGYKVINSIDKIKKRGIIIRIIKRRKNGFPEYVLVRWDDNRFSKEYVIYSEQKINKNIIVKDKFNIFELNQITGINNSLNINKNIYIKNIVYKNDNNNYKGKFKNEKRINWGASPGARSSLNKDYFSTKRLYKVNQKLIADYLNFKRLEKGLTKKSLTNLFPKSYKHTVGHWLRKDFGGSIPIPSDWFKLTKILNINPNMTNYVCKTALKLQTVKNAKFKPPEDFININSIKIFNKLIK